eukprot:COSAG03_NODE_544_length_7025_cov_8.435894_2_plen_152_part_00
MRGDLANCETIPPHACWCAIMRAVVRVIHRASLACLACLASAASASRPETAALRLQRPHMDRSGWWDTHHFGVNDHGQFTEVPDDQKASNQAQFLPAFDGGRWDPGWETLEKQKGVYNFSAGTPWGDFDGWTDEHLKHGKQPIAILCYGNP